MSAQKNNGYALQPIIDLVSREVLYCEMLVRFPDGRNVQRTIINAENDRTIHEIDFWVLEKAAAVIREEAPTHMVAVNLSPVTIEQHYRELMGMVNGFGDISASLVLEVTETAPILEPLVMAAFTTEMHRAGIRVALDDYGSGFCDATRALFVRPDFIKIAKEGRNGWSTMLDREWEALREFAHMSESKLIGEGVETARDLQQILAMGFDLGQGFHFRGSTHAASRVALVESAARVSEVH